MVVFDISVRGRQSLAALALRGFSRSILASRLSRISYEVVWPVGCAAGVRSGLVLDDHHFLPNGGGRKPEMMSNGNPGQPLFIAVGWSRTRSASGPLSKRHRHPGNLSAIATPSLRPCCQIFLAILFVRRTCLGVARRSKVPEIRTDAPPANRVGDQKNQVRPAEARDYRRSIAIIEPV